MRSKRAVDDMPILEKSPSESEAETIAGCKGNGGKISKCRSPKQILNMDEFCDTTRPLKAMKRKDISLVARLVEP
jgi:hypothetical protein